MELVPLMRYLSPAERSSLSFALELTADFLGVDVADVLANSAAPLLRGGLGAKSDDRPQVETTAPQADESAKALRVDISGERAQKLRAKIARELYADDLKADLVDRTTAAIVAKLASKQEINRAIAAATRSARDNDRRGVEPTRAWLLFYPYLKEIYDRNGVAFPKLAPRLEVEPPEIAARREKDEKDKRAVAATLAALDE